MKFKQGLLAAASAMFALQAAVADPVPVKQSQGALHAFLTVRSEAGKLLGSAELVQLAHGDEVTTRLTYTFLDGSIDDDTTTFTQRGTFKLVRDHRIQKGPFFKNPIDITVDAASGTVTTRSTGKDGKPREESQHMDLPADLGNGLIGDILENVPHDAAPFKLGDLAPSGKGRLVQVAISPDSTHTFRVAGRSLKATVFRVHPEIGGVAGVIAPLLGKQPKDTLVWVLEGEAPTVVRIVGQLAGDGPVVDSQLMGVTFH